ncbi:MAG: response regulator [Spirochaetaceae bacterium]|nr:MAG: response regulator [Spirochaetaceae bacterium]
MEGLRVLIVDDLPFMRVAIKDALSGTAFAVVAEAENGIQGVERYQEYHPDVVLLDIVMPVLDGLSALKRIRRLDPRSNVIMCSALGEQAMILRAIQLGARDFIVKPFQPSRVVSALAKVAAHP